MTQPTPHNRAERRASLKNGSLKLKQTTPLTEMKFQPSSPSLDSINMNQFPPLSQLESPLSLDPKNHSGTGVPENAEQLLEEAVVKVRAPKFKKLHTDLMRLLATLGVGVAVISQPDGLTIIQRADGLANALVDLAEKDNKVYAALAHFVEDSVYLNLGLEVAALGGALLANHGINPIEGIKNFVASIFHKKEPEKKQGPPIAQNVPVEGVADNRDILAVERLLNV